MAARLRHPVPAPWLQCLRVRAVERGRASWAKFPEINPVPPCFNSYAERWTTYRLGPKYPESYEGTRFDADKYDVFHQVRARCVNCTSVFWNWAATARGCIFRDGHSRQHPRMMQEDNSRQIADLVCDWLVKKVPCGSK